jgi:hypothetical protein
MKFKFNYLKFLGFSIAAATCGFGFSQIALSQEPASGLETETLAAETTGVTSEASVSESQPQRFISDGTQIEFESLGIRITPPAGWEVLENMLGMTLVMQEPYEKDIPGGKLKFKRNITVVSMHEAAPIDDKEAVKLKERLVEEFGKEAGVSDFQVLGDHKFFNYKAENDGIIYYSTFLMGDIQMSQMHIFVSGQDNRFLITYTDMADEFQANEAAYQAAWASMISIDVTGAPPTRYLDLAIYGGGTFAALLAIFGLIYLRRRSGSRFNDFDDYESDNYSSSSTSYSHVGSWNDDVHSAVKSVKKKKSSGKGRKEESYDSDDIAEVSSISNF